jgi:hypothetical protein
MNNIDDEKLENLFKKFLIKNNLGQINIADKNSFILASQEIKNIYNGNHSEDDFKIVEVRLLKNKKDINSFKEWSKGNLGKDWYGDFPIFDIMLINNTNSVKYLNKIILNYETKNIEKNVNKTNNDGTAEYITISLPICLPSTYDYSTILDDKCGSKEIQISQVINPFSADRFSLIIATSISKIRSISYKIELSLHYNSSQKLELGKYNLRIYPPLFPLPHKSIVL